MEELIPFFAVIGFGGLVWFLVWLASRSRGSQRTDMLGQLSQAWGGRPVHRVTALGYAEPFEGFEVAVNGRPSVVFSRQNGRRDLCGFQLAVGQFPLAVFRRETGLDRFGRALRLNREVQTGDPEFDREVYIETDDDEAAIRAMLAPDAVRAAIRKAAAHRISVVTSREGVGMVAYTLPKQNPQHIFNLVLPDIQAIADVLPASTGGRGVRARARGDIAAPVSFFALIGAYVFYTAAHWTKSDAWEPWMNADIKRADHIGAWAFLALVVLSYVWMRGHSRSLRNFLATVILGGWALGSITPLALYMLNAGLDHSAPVAHETTVISKYSRSTKSYTHHVLRFNALFHANQTSSLDVPGGLYRDVNPGDHIRVNLREGAFGWKWVSSVERISPGG